MTALSLGDARCEDEVAAARRWGAALPAWTAWPSCAPTWSPFRPPVFGWRAPPPGPPHAAPRLPCRDRGGGVAGRSPGSRCGGLARPPARQRPCVAKGGSGAGERRPARPAGLSPPHRGHSGRPRGAPSPHSHGPRSHTRARRGAQQRVGNLSVALIGGDDQGGPPPAMVGSHMATAAAAGRVNSRGHPSMAAWPTKVNAGR